MLLWKSNKLFIYSIKINDNSFNFINEKYIKIC